MSDFNDRLRAAIARLPFSDLTRRVVMTAVLEDARVETLLGRVSPEHFLARLPRPALRARGVAGETACSGWPPSLLEQFEARWVVTPLGEICQWREALRKI